MNDELSERDVTRMFPGWDFRTGTDLLRHAVRRDRPDITATGEDWTDLADQIRRADARLARQWHESGNG